MTDGYWLMTALHRWQPKLKKGLTDFLRCECTVAQMSAKVAEWNADDLERAMRTRRRPQ
jgi:hypothetical protein